MASLACGVGSCLGLGFLAGIPAVILGHRARRQARTKPEQFAGGGMAMGGLVAGYLGILLSIAAISFAFAAAHKRAAAVGCTNNLKQIGIAFGTWARDYMDRYPFNTPVAEGGTREVCDVDAEGFDRASWRHLQVMSNELNWPKVLICPGDHGRRAAAGVSFSRLTAGDVSYQVRSGKHITPETPEQILVVCPIHGNALFCDGRVAMFSQPELRQSLHALGQSQTPDETATQIAEKPATPGFTGKPAPASGKRPSDGTDPDGDTIQWEDGTIWSRVTITTVKVPGDGAGPARLEVTNVPPGFRAGWFTNFTAAALRGEASPPKRTDTVDASLLWTADYTPPSYGGLPALKRQYKDSYACPWQEAWSRRASMPENSARARMDGEPVLLQFGVVVTHLAVERGKLYCLVRRHSSNESALEGWCSGISTVMFGREPDMIHAAEAAASRSPAVTAGGQHQAWQRDCGVFIQMLTDLAPRAAGGEQFEKKEVLWDLVFKEVSTDRAGNEQVVFDLEPFGLKFKFFSGKPVLMGGFAPAAGSIAAWKQNKPGSKVRVKAVVATVFFVTMSPGNNPGMNVPVAVVSIEQAALAK